MKILILGANGFIGSHLSEYILANRDWDVYAMDIASDKITECLDNPHFHFVEGDITINKEWVEYHVKKCDVIIPLVAIANPATYVKNPLSVFELDFEANLEIVRHCVKYKKRLIFPSTSEVYGMSSDNPYDEEESLLVTGPIKKERWIYSTSKQLMDRVIYAYGGHQGLDFTLFRPFNWFGPKLDNVWESKEGSSRVATQFLSNIFHGREIVLVGGGQQRRCFLYIDDAIDALMRIIENKNGKAAGQIFNIGHPENDVSVAQLAEMMIEVASEFEGYENVRDTVKIVVKSGEEFFGVGYQDLVARVPKIENAKDALGWTPTTDIKDGIRKTIAYYQENIPAGAALVKL
ncbi:MAG: bifunctional UDP-4-keto-pentose/UDP-xylose synthase [Rickettsiales bacterium]